MKKIVYGAVLGMVLSGHNVAIADSARNKDSNHESLFSKNLNNNLLADKINGQFTLKVDLGYLVNLPGKLNKSYQDGTTDSTALGAYSSFGYGASFGYTSNKKWGLAFDYLGFNRKWNNDSYNYQANYHIIGLTPSYRFSLDKKNQWGIRLGLGVGVALSDITYTRLAVPTGGTAIIVDVKSPEHSQNCTFRTDGDGLKPGDRVAFGKYSSTVVTEKTLPGGNIGPNRCVHFQYGKGFTDKGEYKVEADAILTPRPKPFDANEYIPLPDKKNTSLLDEGIDASAAGSTTTARGGASMVLAPQIAAEYDNGYFHADINARYIVALQKFHYTGREDNDAVKHTSNPGSLAFFVGAGMGVNF